jgi:hypothetical protein
MNECYNIGLDPRTAIEGSFSAWGVSENQIAGATAARLTAVAIAIATRPFKFHEISVSNTSSSFVSSIHSFGFNRVYRLEIQSDMLEFSTGFVNSCPSNLLSG